MAFIPKMFPHMKGRVGGLVYKTRLGKQYVASVPEQYTPSHSEPAVKGRNNFAFYSRLSHAISNNYVLNAFWRDIKIPGLITQNIIYKCMSKIVTGYDLAGITLAFCDSPFEISLKEVRWQEKTLNISLHPLGGDQNIKPVIHPVICAQGFVYSYNPAKAKKDQFTFLPFIFSDQLTNTTDDLCFSFTFTHEMLMPVNSAPVRKLVLNLALKNEVGRPVRCSNTLCYDLPNNPRQQLIVIPKESDFLKIDENKL